MEAMVTDNVGGLPVVCNLNFASHQSGVASPATGRSRRQLMCQLYIHMKTSILGRNGNVKKNERLRREFYLHLKSWLAPRVNVAEESDLEKAKV